ncbi:MAG: hypothetical protein E6J65_23465 [Deltaproteobacteria bacterium]|nr:MAG: hypothetical protein E6J65_23465 [Deltaproteobacteria bacterium]
MRFPKGLLPVLFTVAVSACENSSTGDLAAEASTMKFAVSSAGCDAVSYHVTATPLGTISFEGVVTGDLEGTATFEFDASSVMFAGKTISNSGTATWSIAAGILGPVEFSTTFDNHNLDVDRPGSPSDVFENIGQHRVLAGVKKANLSYQGVFRATPTPVTNLDFRGVICL